jgi:hypothetical protein
VFRIISPGLEKSRIPQLEVPVWQLQISVSIFPVLM